METLSELAKKVYNARLMAAIKSSLVNVTMEAKNL